jgi:large subunit ribosomal protein L22
MQSRDRMRTARAFLRNARISLKHAIIICDRIRRKKLEKAKKFLEDLVEKKVNINKKYYTKAAKQILELLKTAEANAKNKNLNLERLWVRVAKADKGEKFISPKSRAKFRGRKAKSTHIEIVLGEG